MRAVYVSTLPATRGNEQFMICVTRHDFYICYDYRGVSLDLINTLEDVNKVVKYSE